MNHSCDFNMNLKDKLISNPSADCELRRSLSCGWGIEQVGGMLNMLKCPWARHWTLGCSWWTGQRLASLQKPRLSVAWEVKLCKRTLFSERKKIVRSKKIWFWKVDVQFSRCSELKWTNNPTVLGSALIPKYCFFFIKYDTVLALNTCLTFFLLLPPQLFHPSLSVLLPLLSSCCCSSTSSHFTPPPLPLRLSPPRWDLVIYSNYTN